MSEQTVVSAESARQQETQSWKHLRHLERRSERIGTEIVGAERAVSVERRQGRLGVEARRKLERLEAEKVELPERIFEARVAAFVASIAAEEARAVELTPQVEEARKELEPAVEAVREAAERSREARGRAERLRRQYATQSGRQTLPGYQQSPSEIRDADDEARELEQARSEAKQREAELRGQVTALEGRRRAAEQAVSRRRTTLRDVEERGIIPLG